MRGQYYHNVYPQEGLDDGVTPKRRQDIIWTNASSIRLRLHAELREMS